jgi:lactate permease
MTDMLLFIIGILPIIWLFLALCVLRLPGHIACPGGLALAAILAFFVIGMRPLDIGTAALEGMIFAIWPILLVAVSALILYKYSVATGGMDVIKNLLTGISCDKRILVLMLAWGFGSFLEAIAGFGSPVLIPGSILVSLGFSPMFSIVACLIANSIPTPYATIGIPVTTLAGVTGLDPGVIGFNVAMQIFIPCLILPFFIVMLTGGGFRAIKGVGLITLIAGLSLGLPILVVSKFLGSELPALFGSLCTLLCITLANKKFYKDNAYNRQFQLTSLPAGKQGAQKMSVFQACLPFLLVLLFVAATRLISPLNAALSRIKLDIVVFSGPDGYVLNFSFLMAAGILILISVFLSCFLQGFNFLRLLSIITSTLAESKNMCITVITIIAMAKIMDYSGMTDAIALMLIAVFSVFYPLVAPVIGMFGVFITGSNTTCAILFGNLQAGAARAIGVSPSWIVSSNMSAAALGKMISPQSIAVGLRIGGLDRKEGAIIRQTLKYSLFSVAIVCVITYIFV